MCPVQSQNSKSCEDTCTFSSPLTAVGQCNFCALQGFWVRWSLICCCFHQVRDGVLGHTGTRGRPAFEERRSDLCHWVSEGGCLFEG